MEIAEIEIFTEQQRTDFIIEQMYRTFTKFRTPIKLSAFKRSFPVNSRFGIVQTPRAVRASNKTSLDCSKGRQCQKTKTKSTKCTPTGVKKSVASFEKYSSFAKTVLTYDMVLYLRWQTCCGKTTVGYNNSRDNV